MSDLHELAENPSAFDEAEAALHAQAARLDAEHDSAMDDIHRAAGDKKQRYGHRYLWKSTDAEVLARMQAGPVLFLGRTPEQLVARLDALHDDLTAALAQIGEMEAVWKQYRWNRFYPCLNRDGHIHSTYHGCPTVRLTTLMAWYPALSGKTTEDAVAELGEALCSVCFPDAPVSWKSKTLGQVKDERTAAERAAAKAARDDARYMKQLREDEEFKDHDRRWVTTVARLKEILRDEVMYRDYYGHGTHPSHPGSVTDAEKAAALLLAREAARAGSGATQEQIGKIIANAVKANIKNGARLDKEGNLTT